MDCERHNQNLSAFLDGRLSRKEGARVEAHLRTCRRCREDLAELTHLRQMLANLPDAEPSPGFWQESLHTIRTAVPSRRSVTQMRLRQGLFACAATASIILVAMLARIETPTSIPTTTEPTTLHADSLVALSSSLRTELPLADTGTLRFARTNGIASDWANDHKLDFE
jgi:predicted anti-sigma-YlaC factor YlaD